MDRLAEPSNQVAMRSRAAALAPSFSDWAWRNGWRSIELGRPADLRFEDAFAGYDSALRSSASAQAARAGGTESHVSQTDNSRAANEELTRKLLQLTTQPVRAPAGPAPQEFDAIVSHIEVNDRHGVGALLGKLFGDATNVLSIRSHDYYAGVQSFGALALCIAHPNTRRDHDAWRVLQALIRRIAVLTLDRSSTRLNTPSLSFSTD